MATDGSNVYLDSSSSDDEDVVGPQTYEAKNEDFEDWVEEEDERPYVRSLFSSEIFRSLEDCVRHDQIKFNFSITAFTKGMEVYTRIKLVNYIRAQVTKGVAANDVIASLQDPKNYSDDQYLKPVVPEDPLLCVDDDDDEDHNNQDVDSMDLEEKYAACQKENDSLKEQLAALHSASQAMKQYIAQTALDPQELAQMAGGATASACTSKAATNDDDDDDVPPLEDVDGADGAPLKAPSKPASAKEEPKQDNDTYYFDSYTGFGIHEEMIKDKIRTEAYRDFMLQNPGVFKDKVVLDVGCGTGILSLFAAQAGAKQVFSVDSANITETTKMIVRNNGFSDRITVIKGKVEEINLPLDTVDIIISEWMGYHLLYESMLDSVIVARDRWLSKEGGCVYPDEAIMYISALEGSKDTQGPGGLMHFWKDVYGFDFSCITTASHKDAEVGFALTDSLLSEPSEFKFIDINHVKYEDLEFKGAFKLTASRDGVCDVLLSHFDINFKKGCDKPISFSTGPRCTGTHWKQCFFYLKHPITLKQGQVFEGAIYNARNAKNPRQLDVVLEYNVDGQLYKQPVKLK